MKNLHMTIEQSSLSDQVYDGLKGLILSGSLGGGEHVPEEQLAAQFGVSRTPIREALKRLAEYGLIVIKPRSKVTVAAISKDEAVHIGRVRQALETLAFELLAEKGDTETFAELERVAGACQDAMTRGDRAKAFELDTAFHQKMMDLSGNPTLADIYKRLDSRIQLLRLRQHLTPQELLPYMVHHIHLIRFMRTGDIEKAKDIISQHIFHDID